MTGGETSRGRDASDNHATMFFTVSPRPDVDDTSARDAYSLAAAHLARLPAIPAQEEGYRLFWVRGNEVGHRDVGPDDHAIVGRHSACDVVLGSAPELSLRHLLVATTPIRDAPRGLRVLDLRASLPFYTDDGQPRRSIIATGPVVLRLGSYLFGGVPIGPSIERAALPDEMPRAVVTCPVSQPSENGAPNEQSTMLGEDDPDVDHARIAAILTSPPGAPSADASSALLSRVTVVPATALLTEVANPSAPDAFARLTLVRDGHSASIELPASDLDAGVLIGRSERCTDGGLRRVLDGNISRIHVLLLREADDVLVFDLCSTQGTFDGARSVRRHRVSRAGGCVSLARTNPVMLCLHPREDAPPSAPPPGS